MNKPVVLGYCDPFSAGPGEQIRFMVSCEASENYQCQMVRLQCCETGPGGPGFRETALAGMPTKTYPGRQQSIEIGSYVLVPEIEVGGGRGVAAQAIVWPTRLNARPQAVLGNWHERDQRGFCLYLDETGALALQIGNGKGQSSRTSTGTALGERCWYLVGASFDAASNELLLFQRPLNQAGFTPPARPVEISAVCTTYFETFRAPFLIGAWAGCGERRTGGHFDGKIERPLLLARPFTTAEVNALRAPEQGLPPSLPTDPALLGLWDFSEGIQSDFIRDLSSREHHGTTINCPTRAVRGHDWTGEEFDWRHATSQYGAIHFHSDDLGDAGWEADFTFTVPTDVESGVFAARLSAGDSQFHIPFVVRPGRDGPRHDTVLLLSSATYTAYANCRERFLSNSSDLNQGRLTVLDELDLLLLQRSELGLSTYDRHADGSGVVYGSRLRPVLNNRPITSDISVAYDNFAADLLIVDWLSRLGIEFDVITDEDLHTDGLDALRDHRLVITSTHPEYASRRMRDALDGHLRLGGRLIYMGGNGLYWRIAFHPRTTGIMEVRRAEDGVRAWECEPGEAFHSFTGEYGGLWRRQGRPPNETLGVGFIAQGFDASTPYVRTAGSHDPRVAFIFENVDSDRLGETGLLAGGAAGLEIDCACTLRGTPAHALVVANSVGHSAIYHLVPEEINNTNGFTDGTLNPDVRSDIVFFETPSGGAVFSVGSIAFAGSLSTNGYDNDVARIMENVVTRFRAPEPFRFPGSMSDPA